MNLDAPILAHGDVFRLLGSLFGALAVIVICVLNALIAIPFGSLITWRLFRARRMKFRIAAGAVAACLAFIGLCFVEFVSLLIAISTR